MTSLPDPDVVFAEHPELGIVAATASTPDGPDRGDHALTARGWIHHEELDIFTLPGRLDRASALTVVSGSIRALQNKGRIVAADPGLAQAVFHSRTEARNAAPLASRVGPHAAVAAVQTAPAPRRNPTPAVAEPNISISSPASPSPTTPPHPRHHR
ncbi:hypothetical protein [Streptomyces sp. SPB074]|uniref:hypothetical protein n=1 Tax=Streptomyces sp. (strain SPB074) TaxID=465543 RepID=UPI00017F1CB9|nr:hypothetical protein [Streptomyces sp. SPB074]EDY43036.1 conserved hypothetical protein [Streptomyces sp. SPB074]